MIIIPLIENTTNLTALLNVETTHIMVSDNLVAGGTTVSKGVMGESLRYARDHGASVDFIIRARGGDAHYNDLEIKVMEADVLLAQQLGADGVVLTALADNDLDHDALENLVAATGGMTATFGPDLDQLQEPNRIDALKWLAQAGFERVLTRQFNQFEARLDQAQKLGLSLVPMAQTADELHALKKVSGLTYLVNQTPSA